ncbi:TIGR03086 family metal-binding protein [Streptomyces sp. IB2014 016-6]|uniref:TIGR03086 family metal-binding protein n=1 Tax=Streptomyces sp. IB2014 016-6 TaxID=2517818 RepID=UPI0011C9210A|nr:TIGR03086 family metal-binding protein [Streptomyces sp. IB2014 016-6]TXL87654.1 TIGR03086 family protein [Streptomyces sp. IB2014 016-6]
MDDPLLDRHGEALDLFTDRVHAVDADQWRAGTPCTEWSVRDLVNHLTSEQLWVPPLVSEGRSMAEVGDAFDGDVLGEDPVATWDRAAAAARAAFAERGALERTVQLSYGVTPVAAYCSQMVLDAVVHTWDLSRGIGVNERLPRPLVDFALKEVEPYAGSLSGSGLFDAPLEPPPGADAQTRLLAMLGRESGPSAD